MKSAVLFTAFLLVGAHADAQTAAATPQVYKSGQGVVLPRVLADTKPVYTPEAMTSGIEGSVLLECVVNADGTVGDVRVMERLDPGLDAQAEKALKAWRFIPGTKDGTAVPVLVQVEMSFALGNRGPSLDSPEVFIAGQNGVTLPKAVQEAQPSYTAEALQSRVQGTVTIEAVVLPSGRVGDVRVTKALEPGLDREAIKALKQWRFEPGLRNGTAVPTKVTLEMIFTLK